MKEMRRDDAPAWSSTGERECSPRFRLSWGWKSLRRRSRQCALTRCARLGALAASAYVASAILSGCSSARHTPPLAPTLQFSDAKLNHGRQLYYQHCHYCHPHGGAGLGPAIVNKPLPGFLMKIQVRHGLGAMPSFKEEKLPTEDLDVLIAYIKAVHANKPDPEKLR